MDIGILKKDDSQIRVPFMDATVLMSFVPTSETLAIRKQATQTKWGSGEQTFNAAEANRLMGARAVKGWEGFTLEGAEFPFNDENRDLLMTRWGEFSDFVWSTAQSLQALQAAEKEQKAKNS